MYTIENLDTFKIWQNKFYAFQIQKFGASSYRVVVFKLVNDELQFVTIANYTNPATLLRFLSAMNIHPSNKTVSLL